MVVLWGGRVPILAISYKSFEQQVQQKEALLRGEELSTGTLG